MRIELPFLPPSVNQAYYTDFKSRTRHKSKEYRQFKKDIAYYLPKEKIEGKIKVEYNFYFTTNHKRDVANYEKILTDCLVACQVIEDDSLIQRMVLEKYKGEEPLTLIEIKSID